MPQDPTKNAWATGAAIPSLTDSSGGTADNTIGAIGVVYAQAEVRDAVADLAAKTNVILAALRAAGIIVS